MKSHAKFIIGGKSYFDVLCFGRILTMMYYRLQLWDNPSRCSKLKWPLTVHKVCFKPFRPSGVEVESRAFTRD